MEGKLITHQKLSNWFRGRYNNRKGHQESVDEVISAMLQMSKSRPRKKTELSVYLETYYASKLKAEFVPMWDDCLRGGVQAKERISTLNKFAQVRLDKEPPEVQMEIRRSCQEANEASLTEYKERFDWKGDAEDYDK
jgi:hypothetical protein